MARILLIGEDLERGRTVRSLLRQDGHAVTWNRAVERWGQTESHILPEVVVAAVGSTDPVLEVDRRPPRGFPAPLLFVQHETDVFRDVLLEERLVDHIRSPFTVEELLARVDALIRLRRMVLRAGQGTRGRIPSGTGRHGVRGLGSRLRALLGTRVPRLDKPTAPYVEVVTRVAAWADARDMFEPGHAERVTSLADMMADALLLPDSEAASLLRAAMLHDIGKVAFPVEVLRKKGPLEEQQMRLIRTHPERGAALLNALDPDEEVARAVLCHHERIDGSGYYGKKDESFSRSSRILAVAEAYDAMTTSRVGETLTKEGALGLLRADRGARFDPDCVDSLVDVLRPRLTYLPVSDFGPP